MQIVKIPIVYSDHYFGSGVTFSEGVGERKIELDPGASYTHSEPKDATTWEVYRLQAIVGELRSRGLLSAKKSQVIPVSLLPRSVKGVCIQGFDLVPTPNDPNYATVRVEYQLIGDSAYCAHRSARFDSLGLETRLEVELEDPPVQRGEGFPQMHRVNYQATSQWVQKPHPEVQKILELAENTYQGDFSLTQSLQEFKSKKPRELVIIEKGTDRSAGVDYFKILFAHQAKILPNDCHDRKPTPSQPKRKAYGRRFYISCPSGKDVIEWHASWPTGTTPPQLAGITPLWGGSEDWVDAEARVLAISKEQGERLASLTPPYHKNIFDQILNIEKEILDQARDRGITRFVIY